MKLIITVITSFLQALINAVLGPINSLILAAIPGIEQPLQQIQGFFTWLVDFVTWAMSFLPFTTTFWSFFVVYWVFRLTIPLAVHAVKLVVKWWHALAP